MTLTLDIGNSSVKAGLFRDAELVDSRRFGIAEWDAVSDFILQRSIQRAGIVSVVPTLTTRALDTLRSGGDVPVTIIGPRMKLPFTMAYQTPDTLGADRLAAAAGAKSLFSAADPLLVVDAGTAITVEVLASGAYRGGAIAPGPDLLRKALAAGTAQLPEVHPELPSSAIGTSTREAIQVGVMGGTVETVRGLIERITRELGRQPVVVATGGWAPLLANHIATIQHVEPDLVLQGAFALIQLNS